MPLPDARLTVVPADGSDFVALRAKPDDLKSKIVLRVTPGSVVIFKQESRSGETFKVSRRDLRGNTAEGWVKREDVAAEKSLPPDPLTEELFLQRLPYESRVAGSNGIWLVAVALAETEIEETSNPAAEKFGPFNFTPQTWKEAIDAIPDTPPAPDTIAFWDMQIIAAANLVVRNAKALSEVLGTPANAWQLYLAHVAGLAAAKAMLTASDDSIGVDKALEQAGIEPSERARLLKVVTGARDAAGAPASLKDLFDSLKTRLQKGLDRAHVLLKIDQLHGDLGSLSREFESAGNPGAIGFDRTGGWSYGPYQFASKRGIVAKFLKLLETDFPVFAQALNDVGGDAAAREGDERFKKEWERLAKDPEFVRANHGFTKTRYYDPCIAKLSKEGILEVNGRAKAVHDVVWSTSVQHGVAGATRMFGKALTPRGDPKWNDDKAVIDALYTERKRVDVHFRSSTQKVRNSVLKRFQTEHRRALAMLEEERSRVLVPQPPGGGDFRSSAVNVAHREMTTFARRPNGKKITESEEPMHGRALEYFRLLGDNRKSPVGKKNPWSAAFISFVMRDAGATQSQFPFSVGHWKYILAAMRNKIDAKTNASIVYFDIEEIAPRVGDLVGFSNTAAVATASDIQSRLSLPANKQHFSSHTDMVTSVRSGEITVIGGNVSNTIGERRVLTQKTGAKAGHIKPGQDPRYFFVLRLNI